MGDNMNKINELKAMLETKAVECSDIETQLQDEYNKIFDDCLVLRDAVAELNRSTDYTFDEYGEVCAWVRFNDFDKFEECEGYLTEWFNDQGIRAEMKNHCIVMPQGGVFLIGEDGDVYNTDNGKIVVHKSEYVVDGEENEALRNQIIELHMQATGYFPGVFRTDTHGNVFHVNTTEK